MIINCAEFRGLSENTPKLKLITYNFYKDYLVKPLQVAFIICLLIYGSFLFCINWLKLWLMKIRAYPSLEDKLLSMVVLVVSTILWPLIVPAYLELL